MFVAGTPALELSFLRAGGPRSPATFLAAQGSSAPNDGATRHVSGAVSFECSLPGLRPSGPFQTASKRAILRYQTQFVTVFDLNPSLICKHVFSFAYQLVQLGPLFRSVICCPCAQGNPEISKARWTAEEDERLGQLVAEHGNAWACIARQLPGRTDQQCMVHPCTPWSPQSHPDLPMLLCQPHKQGGDRSGVEHVKGSLLHRL